MPHGYGGKEEIDCSWRFPGDRCPGYETWGNRFGCDSKAQRNRAIGGIVLEAPKRARLAAVTVCAAGPGGYWRRREGVVAMGAPKVCESDAGAEPAVSGQDRANTRAPVARSLFDPGHPNQ